MSVVRFENVAKSLPHGFWLRRKEVLRDVSLSVEQGEVYGFLGPNGAGKTTSLKCLLGLLKPEAGTVEIFGRPGSDPEARERLGYLPEHPYFYPHLTGRELVDYFGRLFDIPANVRRERTDALIESVGMTAKANQPIKQYSKGMLQRIGLAQALINDPDLLILDEPMSGLDPIGRREVKDIILDLKSRGTTIFFSSHILADAEALCDRVGLLFEGRIVLESGVDELLEGRVEYWDATCDDVAPELLSEYTSRATQGGRLYFRISEGDELDAWVDKVRAAGGRVVQVSPHRHTLAIRGERGMDEAEHAEDAS
jgi:ABC-2 type transport system ATP-binding protein